MKVVIQRVKAAHVSVNGGICGSIDRGLLVFFAVHRDDDINNIEWMAEKIINLRIFPDDNDKMNLSLRDIIGEILVVSQFTLYGTCNKGRRPEFTRSAPPEKAEKIYNEFVEAISKKMGKKVATGRFRANMEVHLINDGPITLELEKL